jgi:hypothetical protein
MHKLPSNHYEVDFDLIQIMSTSKFTNHACTLNDRSMDVKPGSSTTKPTHRGYKRTPVSQQRLNIIIQLVLYEQLNTSNMQFTR